MFAIMSLQVEYVDGVPFFPFTLIGFAEGILPRSLTFSASTVLASFNAEISSLNEAIKSLR